MSYWTQILSQRTSRRHALATTGAAAASAAFLAACGGGGNGGGETTKAKKDASGFITQPEDTTKSAKVGGTFKWYAP
jgi:hypothetical protein